MRQRVQRRRGSTEHKCADGCSAAQLSSFHAARALLKRRNSRARRATPSTSPRSRLKTKTLVSRRPTLATRHLPPLAGEAMICSPPALSHLGAHWRTASGNPYLDPSASARFPCQPFVSGLHFFFLLPLTLLSQCSCCLSGDSWLVVCCRTGFCGLNCIIKEGRKEEKKTTTEFWSCSIFVVLDRYDRSGRTPAVSLGLTLMELRFLFFNVWWIQCSFFR